MIFHALLIASLGSMCTAMNTDSISPEDKSVDSGKGGPSILAEFGQLASNTSALVGSNASFYCEVIGEPTNGQNLRFDRILKNGTSYFIFGTSTNPELGVNDPIKYDVTDKYRLHVKNITFEDEGIYRCVLDAVDTTPHEAALTVADPPDSVEMYWSGGQDWTPLGVRTNLTCKAGLSRPPATMTWLRGNIDITGIANKVNVAVDYNGYGEGISYLEMTPSAAEEGVIYTCKVNVMDITSILTQQLRVSFSGSSAVASSFALLLTAFVVSL